MLHAINQGKSGIYKRYLGHRDGEEVRVNEEDELTALLLGSLALLPEQDVAVFWHHLLIYLQAPGYTSLLPVKANMIFWPSVPAEPKQRIEPDLMVELVWPEGQRISLIVELKWRAPLSGKDQLHRQWRYCLSDTEKNVGYHLFIAPETGAAIIAKGSNLGNIWNGRLLDVSWYRLIGMFDLLPSNLQPWAKQVRATLKKLGIQRFVGFKKLQATPVLGCVAGKPLFWKGMLGFKEFPCELTSFTLPLLTNNLFFSKLEN